MRKRKDEIVVKKQQYKKEESAVAENADAHFSNNGGNEQQVVQLDIVDIINDAEKQKKEEELTQEQQLNNVEETVAKQKTKKKKWTSLILLLVNICVVAGILIFQIKGENMAPLSELFESGLNWWFVLVCVLCYVVISLLEGAKIGVLVHDATKKHHYALSYKTGMIGRYYDCITPMATGGQPFQIYYLKKHGLTGSQSLSVPTGKYIFQQITSVIICTFVIFASLVQSRDASIGATVVSAASWIGYVLNSGLIILVLFISINRKFGTKLVGGAIKIGHKIKLVKDYDKTYNKVIKLVDDFQSTFKYYVKSPKTFIASILVSGISCILNYSIPFFIYCSFSGYQAGLWSSIFVKCVMIDLASSFIPLPGGTGAAELSFTTLFASMFVGGRLVWALLFWRILTYYGYILQGLLIIIYDYFIGDKKYDWQKRKGELELESEKFKAQQLSEFKNKKLKKLKK